VNNKNSKTENITISRKEFDALLELKCFVDRPVAFGCTIDLGFIDRGWSKRVGYVFENAQNAIEAIHSRLAPRRLARKRAIKHVINKTKR
jgi:hypothetical protein